MIAQGRKEMKRTLLLMLIVAIVCGFALSIGGCAKKKAGPEGEMGAAAEERVPQPGEPGYEKI